MKEVIYITDKILQKEMLKLGAIRNRVSKYKRSSCSDEK